MGASWPAYFLSLWLFSHSWIWTSETTYYSRVTSIAAELRVSPPNLWIAHHYYSLLFFLPPFTADPVALL